MSGCENQRSGHRFDGNVQSIPVSNRSQITKEQWKELKPTIHQYYVDKELKFKEVTKILKDKHGVTVTHRQFYRKIREWNYQKNIQAQEIKPLLDTPNHKHLIRGREVPPAKIRRHQKSHQNAFVSQPSPPSPARNSRAVPLSPSQVSPIMADISVIDSSSASESPDTLASPPVLNSDERHRNSSPDWNSVDITGSPPLTKLMTALDLERSRDIPSLSLDKPEANEPRCVTAEQVREIFPMQASQIQQGAKPGSAYFTGEVKAYTQENPVPEFEAIDAILDGNLGETGWPAREVQGTGAVYSGCESPISQLASRRTQLRGRQLSPWRSSPLIDNTRLLFEPSPFSTLPSQNELIGVNEWDKYTAADLRKIKFQQKGLLKTFSGMWPAKHLTILKAQTSLGEIYRAQGKFKVAESVFRHVAHVARVAYGPDDIITLDASLRVARNILQEGNYIKAEGLHRKLHNKIHQKFHPDHSLALQSSQILTSILFYLHKDEEASAILRQTLQINLVRFGPRSRTTISSMAALANSIVYLNQEAESEHLLRTALHLQGEGGMAMDRQSHGLMSDLAQNLYRRQQYTESLRIFRETAALINTMLGSQHAVYLRETFWIALNLKRLVHLEEGETLCKQAFAMQSKVLGDKHSDTLDTLELLASFYHERGNLVEAANSYEKVFQGIGEIFGIEHARTLYSCECLGDCYQDQGRNGDARELFQDVLDQVTNKYDDDHPTAVRVRERIEGLGSLDSWSSEEWASTLDSDEEMDGAFEGEQYY